MLTASRERNAIMLKLITNSEAKTVSVGRWLGGVLGKGSLVCLVGEIGAGKTAFTRGIAEALGISSHITSPTFTIVNEYSAAIPLYHFDVYRLEHSTDLDDIGFEEYLSGDGIVVIEWADMVNDALPKQRITVEFSRNMSEEPDKRVLKIDFAGEKYKNAQNRFREMVNSNEDTGL